MARAKAQSNGRLEEAMAMLIQNQAAFLARAVETDRRMVETDKRIAELERENAERFARIETILLQHSQILAEHSRILHALPDAIKEKIGFKSSATGLTPPTPSVRHEPSATQGTRQSSTIRPALPRPCIAATGWRYSLGRIFFRSATTFSTSLSFICPFLKL